MVIIAIDLYVGHADVFHFPPLDVAFGIRLRLLSDIIPKDVGQHSFNVMSDTLFTVIAKEDERSAFWATTAYRSTHMDTAWSIIQKIVGSRSRAPQGRMLSRKPALRQAIRSSHVFCCWNTLRMEMTFAQTFLFMIDASTVVKGLAQLWNLLEEEGVMSQAWPDMRFLLNVMDDEFFFKTVRPVLKERHTFKSSVLNCIGIKASIFAKATNDDLIHRESDPMYKVRLTYTFNEGSLPVYSFLSHPKWRVGTEAHLCSNNFEMIITATVVQRLLGKKLSTVKLTGDHKIENRVDLLNLQGRGPGSQPLQMLHAVKAGLEQETGLARFDFLAFEQSCASLVDKLVDDMDAIYGGLPVGASASSTRTKVMGIVLLLMKTFDSKDPDEKFTYQWHIKYFAHTFNQWLVTNGSVGLSKTETRRSASKTLFSVKPHVRKEVERIVKRRGLLDNVFTAEQIQGLQSVRVTNTLKETFVDSWVKHKKGKRP